MIRAIMEKEIKELLKSKEFISYYIMLIAVIGIIIPISAKESILNRSWYIMGFVFQIIASIIPSGLTADSFAGEKERKTIETLLLSPVPLAYIFFREGNIYSYCNFKYYSYNFWNKLHIIYNNEFYRI